jgi:hypothetical protein
MAQDMRFKGKAEPSAARAAAAEIVSALVGRCTHDTVTPPTAHSGHAFGCSCVVGWNVACALRCCAWHACRSHRLALFAAARAVDDDVHQLCSTAAPHRAPYRSARTIVAPPAQDTTDVAAVRRALLSGAEDHGEGTVGADVEVV